MKARKTLGGTPKGLKVNGSERPPVLKATLAPLAKKNLIPHETHGVERSTCMKRMVLGTHSS